MSRAVWPFSQTGVLRICSLYVVICVFFEDFGYGKTSKSRRIASTDGGNRETQIRNPLVIYSTLPHFVLVFSLPALGRHQLRKGGSAEWAVPVGTRSRAIKLRPDVPTWYTQSHALCYTLQAGVCGGLPTLREYRRTLHI